MNIHICLDATQTVKSPTKFEMSPTKSSTKSPTKSPTKSKSVSVMSPTRSLMSPTKEIGFRVEPSAVFENEYSLGAYIANAEFETTFNNFRKLKIEKKH